MAKDVYRNIWCKNQKLEKIIQGLLEKGIFFSFQYL
jgi:hypothetical protein